MTPLVPPIQDHADLAEESPGVLRLRLKDRLDMSNAAAVGQAARTVIARERPSQFICDLGRVLVLDDFGVAVLSGLRRETSLRQGRFQLANLSDKARELLALHHFEDLERQTALRGRAASDPITSIGESTIRLFEEFIAGLTFLGASCISLAAFFRQHRILRRADLVVLMKRVGVDAVPIVVLISLLLGLIMAFMSAVQLQQFGANIYVASLVSLSMTRELGPIMTAIIVAGRSASSFASEIGTMKISEEVDALQTMGFDPHHFLVLPRLLASVAVVPVLTLFSDLAAIIGGLIVGVGMLDLTIDGYVHQTVKTLDLFDVSWGVGKSALFALLISWTGCFKGFQVREGAAGVGRATTEAVVTSIFFIILSDSILVILLRYWGE